MPPMEPLPDPHPALLDLLSEAMERIYEEQRIMPAEHAARLAAVGELERHIRTVLPQSHLEIFGSSNSGFGQTGSDLDLALVVPEAHLPPPLPP